MDGTLIDSEPLWLRAEDAMLERFDLRISVEDRLRLVGKGLWDGAEIFRSFGVPLTSDDIVRQWVADVLAGYHDRGVEWRPGAREALADLRAHGIPCALVTMSVRVLAEWLVSQLPAGTFDVVVAGDEVTYAKPHPEPYLMAGASLGVDLRQCLIFEDSPTGLASARATGAVTVGVPNLIELHESEADRILPSLSGLNAAAAHGLFSELARAR